MHLFALFLLLPLINYAYDCEREVFHQLLSDYNPDARPVINSSHSVELHLKIILNEIVDLDEKNQILITSLWLQMFWVDEQLRWESDICPERGSPLNKILIPSNKIWIPDFYAYNSVADEDGEIFNAPLSRAIVQNNGLVELRLPVTTQTSCQLNVRYFPFDHQVCDIKIGSWSYGDKEVKLKMATLDKTKVGNETKNWSQEMSARMENVELAIQGLRILEENILMNNEYNVTHVVLKIHIQRRSLFYGYTVIAPSILLCVITIFSFWLPSGNAQKIDMGLTVFLFLYFLQVMIAENTPESSSPPLIGSFLTMVMTLNSISLVFATIVLYLKRRALTHPCPSVPVFLIRVTKDIFGPLTFFPYSTITEHFFTQMNTQAMKQSSVEIPLYDEELPGVRNSLCTNDNEMLTGRDLSRLRIFEWCYIAQVVDRLLFIIYIIANFISIFIMLIFIPSITDVTL